MDVIWPPEFANAGWALDLSGRFPPGERKKFLKGPVAANSYRGKVYGIPCYLGAGLFYYRKDLLEKYGFKAPETWEQMLMQGREIIKGERKEGLHIYSAQFKQYEGLVCNMMEFVWSRGGDVFDKKDSSIIIGRPESMDAVRFVRDRIIGRAAPMGVLSYEEPESLELFIQGKSVFHRNWPYAWAVTNDDERSRVSNKVGVGSLPCFRGYEPASTLGGWQFGISKFSKHPAEAWRFISFMTSHRSQKILALDAGKAPTRISVYEDREVREKMPHLNRFLPAFKRARPRPLSPVYPMISQELQRFFSMALSSSDSDISSLAREAAGKIARIEKLARSIDK
jgi:multiple sugar transport system substrate-binding protein